MEKQKHAVYDRKIYVRLKNDDECMEFFKCMQQKGYTLGGDMPTKKDPSDIIAVLPEKELCYVGMIGRTAVMSKAENVTVYDDYSDFLKKEILC